MQSLSAAGCRASPCAVKGTTASPAPRALVIKQAYYNKENVDLSRVAQYKTHAGDCGSSSFQVATLTARVEQIGKHLQINKKDHAAKRGLIAILNQRKSLLRYLYREDRSLYDKLISELSIRPVVAKDTRGATREKDAVVLVASEKK